MKMKMKMKIKMKIKINMAQIYILAGTEHVFRKKVM